MAANFGTIGSNLSIGASQSIRRNAGDTAWEAYTPASSTSPGGSNTNIQYNDSSAFGGDANLTWNKTTKLLTTTGGLTIGDNTNTDKVLTFDTSMTYGSDPTITVKATKYYFEFKAPGIDHDGGAVQPLAVFTPNYAPNSFGAWIHAYGGGAAFRCGADPSVGGFLFGRAGYSAGNGSSGSGIGFLGTVGYPITANNSDTGDPALANNAVDLGSTSYRWSNIYSVLLNLSGILTTTADIKLTTAGNGIYIKEGSNATMGTATLSGGTATVSTTKVTANSRIFLTVQSLGTVSVPTDVAVTARSAGTSFTITSANVADTSVVAWMIIEPS